MHNPRWILARTSRRAHLDLGERSSKSLRVLSEHIIVTACRAHVNANAEVVSATYEPICSNCVRIWRRHSAAGASGSMPPVGPSEFVRVENREEPCDMPSLEIEPDRGKYRSVLQNDSSPERARTPFTWNSGLIASGKVDN
jgi:hypothetical protein